MRSYLGIYGATCVAGVLLYSSAFAVHVLGSIRASRRIHGWLIKSIFGAPLRWLDSTPVGRIVARFTQDMRYARTLVYSSTGVDSYNLGQSTGPYQISYRT